MGREMATQILRVINPIAGRKGVKLLTLEETMKMSKLSENSSKKVYKLSKEGIVYVARIENNSITANVI